MLGKLIKYEFKATSMTFFSLYIAIIVFAVCNRLFGSFKLKLGTVITGAILSTLFIALGVVTMIVVIQRFNKNLLGDEGYLMFTLPVKTRNLIFSKLLVTFAWTIASFIVAGITFFILVAGDIHLDVPIGQAISGLWKALVQLDEALVKQMHMGLGVFMILMLIGAIGGYTQFIFMIYGSLAVGQLPIFIKHKIIATVATFIALSVIIGNMVPHILSQISKINQLSARGTMIGINLLMIIIDIALFIGIDNILKKHLNLE